MGIRTVLLYLIGNRQAILTLAASRWTFPVGLCFVVSAALAREYDGKDLVREPWHLLIPAGASIAASFLLVSFIWFGNVIWRGLTSYEDVWSAYGATSANEVASALATKRPSFVSAYITLLGLFWMSAPLAWLYAVPYERFLDLVGAMEANLWTLGVVAAWRVVLMIRVLVVLMGFNPLAASLVVLAFADVVALLGLLFFPVPLLDFMGGLRLSESERRLQSLGMSILGIGGCSLPIWLIVSIVMLASSRLRWVVAASTDSAILRPTRALRIGAILSVVIWAPILPFTQIEQQNRRQVEERFKTGNIHEALDYMSAQSQGDFPPHWKPPYQRERGMNRFADIFEAMERKPPANWVRAIYIETLREELFDWVRNPRRLMGNDLGPTLEKLPEGNAIIGEMEAINRENAESVLGRTLRKAEEKAREQKE
ncbi:MAG: hypothetical protein HY040_21440 [Planctomycetes bacterium]|nr:hypothetical protein [Planctomycetota bacterium]